MNRSSIVILAAVLFLCLFAQVRAADKETVAQYEMIELETRGLASDDMDALIRTPEGKEVKLPAFYSGSGSTWKARYTPSSTGRYSYSFGSQTGHFDVTGSGKDGFLRKGANNPYYPVFDSGRPFFGLGHNIGWMPNDNISGFAKYFADFKANGCNFTRVWINAPWSFPIEYKKIGRYNPASLDKLDSLLKSAEEYGIYMVLVFDTYGSLMKETGQWDENTWSANPYNRSNGGPCEKPEDFFTNETAREWYKNRLRYIVARYSYSPNIAAFELWNEMDAPADWTEEMASYIRSINPHGQFITTSLGYPWANNFDESAIWRLGAIDIVEQHIYGDQVGDGIRAILSNGRELSKRYNKMLLVGEFGMSAARSDNEVDPDGSGLVLHNSIWSAAMSRSFSGALNWWWEEYVRVKNLYPHYLALRNFLNGVRWDSAEIDFLETSPLMKAGEAKPGAGYSEVAIITRELWGNTIYRDFTARNNGEIVGGVVNAYLHGAASKKEIRIEPVFRVDYPINGKFIIKVGMVSQDANLVIYLDDKEALNKKLCAGAGEGPWKKSIFNPDQKVYQCLYDTEFGIDVPKGRHVIRLANTGKDWIGIKRIRLTNYKSGDIIDARIAGLKVGKEMLVWIQNKGSDPIIDASFTIEEAGNGEYSITWWDTREGKVISRDRSTAEGGKLRITVPNFSQDIACRIKT